LLISVEVPHRKLSDNAEGKKANCLPSEGNSRMQFYSDLLLVVRGVGFEPTKAYATGF